MYTSKISFTSCITYIDFLAIISVFIVSYHLYYKSFIHHLYSMALKHRETRGCLIYYQQELYAISPNICQYLKNNIITRRINIPNTVSTNTLEEIKKDIPVVVLL